MNQTYSGTKDSAISEREIRNRELALEAAAEGIVLLKNEESLLPLSTDQPLVLFGAGAVRTIKGGTGSGDVNAREVISIYQGMVEEGFTLNNRTWLDSYDAIYDRRRREWRQEILKETEEKGQEHFFNIYSAHNFEMPDGEEITEEAFENVNTAVYVISRTAGEATDRRARPGDYYLNEKEHKDLQIICENCDDVVVIINSGGQIDMNDILSFPEIKSILYVSQPGMEGGRAIARILSGYYNPCGKLTSTWAVHYEDYPGSEVFSHNDGNVDREPYLEGIYVGYRYFDSFELEPLYAFGHGLSYTSFEISPGTMKTAGRDFHITFTVKNTGKRGGREVVQLYAACPQTEISREFKRLIAFQKTDLISPGESQEVTVTFPAEALASFREETGAWIVEEGAYGLLAGASSDLLFVAGLIQIPETLILSTVPHICPLKEELTEMDRPEDLARNFGAGWRRAARTHKVESIVWNLTEEVRKNPEEVREHKPEEELINRLSALDQEDLISLVIGDTSKWQDNAIGASGISVPGSAGETSGVMKDRLGIDSAVLADGPAGLRLVNHYIVDTATGDILSQGIKDGLEGGFFAEEIHEDNTEDYYQYCTAFPVGTALAQTWNPDLLEKVGRAVSGEMKEFGIRLWLAPGMNIHRNPLCGRNFEYYSEDPVLTGLMAAAITRGVQEDPTTGTTVKHFCCNNQEDNRMGYDAIVSERALREIYLRGFEIAVRLAQPQAIMTSYNLVNGEHTANSADLCTQAARREWGFQGLIMTDWTTTYEHGGSISWKCIAAGNDLIMPGYDGDFDSIRRALASGDLTREQLITCAARVVSLNQE